MDRNKRQINITIPWEVREQLTKEAIEHGHRLAGYIRWLLVKHCKRKEGE